MLLETQTLLLIQNKTVSFPVRGKFLLIIFTRSLYCIHLGKEYYARVHWSVHEIQELQFLALLLVYSVTLDNFFVSYVYFVWYGFLTVEMRQEHLPPWGVLRCN